MYKTVCAAFIWMPWNARSCRYVFILRENFFKYFITMNGPPRTSYRRGGPFMAAIIGPGGPFTAAKNGPGSFSIILLPRPFLAAVNGPPGPV